MGQTVREGEAPAELEIDCQGLALRERHPSKEEVS